MVEEFSLEQRWEDQILARRTAAEVDEAAKAGEIQSILKQRHLKRKKLRVQ